MLYHRLTYAEPLTGEALNFPEEYLSSAILEWDSLRSFVGRRNIWNRAEMKKVIVGCEPIGFYWLTFQKFLQNPDIQLIKVNPFTVNRSMELDVNSPKKRELKVLKTIVQSVKHRRYSAS